MSDSAIHFPHPPEWLPRKIISGGQTGVDRAALDWACLHRIPHGGWCPKGRMAADGPLSPMYQLAETESTGYRQRTKLNVRDSDATLILFMGDLEGGSALTLSFVQRQNKPHQVVSLDSLEMPNAAAEIAGWLNRGHFFTLNVAGPSEKRSPGIYAAAMELFDYVIAAKKSDH